MAVVWVENSYEPTTLGFCRISSRKPVEELAGACVVVYDE